MSNLDVTKAIQPKSDQLNADSLITGDMTIKITDVQVKDGQDQPISIFYEGHNGRPWKPCKTSARCLATIWGKNASSWIGMSCTLYNDLTVTWAGMAVGGVRVSHMEGIDKPRTLQLTKTRGKKSSVVIKPLVVGKPVPKIDNEVALTESRTEAKKGKESFTQWWKDNPDKHDIAKTIMDELKTLMAGAVNDEIPM